MSGVTSLGGLDFSKITDIFGTKTNEVFYTNTTRKPIFGSAGFLFPPAVTADLNKVCSVSVIDPTVTVYYGYGESWPRSLGEIMNPQCAYIIPPGASYKIVFSRQTGGIVLPSGSLSAGFCFEVN